MTYTMVVSLYDLHKEGGSVLHRLGEDLEQVAIVVKVHENIKLLQLHTHKKKNVHQWLVNTQDWFYWVLLSKGCNIGSYCTLHE